VRQLHAPIASKEYPPEKQPTAQQTRHWLAWLAKQLQAQSEDEFLIEKMQPTMLTNRRQKIIYRLIFGLIVGLIFGLIVGLIFGLIVGLIVGLIFGLIVELKTDISSRVKPNQGIRASVKNTLVLSIVAILLVAILLLMPPYLIERFFDTEMIDLTVTLVSYLVLWLAIWNGSGACVQHFSLRLVL
jgi:F0F1-type ATP synthase assembly protein I